jgi:hypothetical protein
VIVWKDFILDDVVGPVLLDDLVRYTDLKVCRGKRVASSAVLLKTKPSVMEDSKGAQAVHIQETGQEQRPARMVGLSGLDFQSSTGTEAGRRDGVSLTRREEEA